MRYTFTLIISIFYITLNAQNISDVVRYSSIDQIGTARTLGVGNAFGAMGGDFSVININPAGIADYRVSEFTFTPTLKGYKTNAFFKKDSLNNQFSKGSGLGLDNIGFVIASNPGGNWTSSNFAVGFSRIADFRRNVLVDGQIKGSITRYFAEQANGKTEAQLDDFVAFPAYWMRAIDDKNGIQNYTTDFDNYFGNINRSQEIFHSGGINELTLGWAGEYKNQLNVGFSVGVPFTSFEEVKTYTETDPNDDIEAFNSLTYTEILNTSGVGLNFKAGFTYKIMNQIRVAGAFHSPTWYRLNDDYSTSLNYSVETLEDTDPYESPDGTFEYKISTPWRVIGSFGTTYRVGEIRGFLNADVEYLDYTNANYNGTAFNSSAEELKWTNEVNRNILNKLGTATNVRLGTEFGYKNLRLRAGYSFEQSPFNADIERNNKTSFGIGFREDKFFIDLGFRIAENVEGYNPYVVIDSELDPLANITTSRTRGSLTVGFKF